MLEHRVGVRGDPVLDEINVDALSIILLLLHLRSLLLFFLRSFLQPFQLEYLLLSKLIHFLQVTFELGHLFLFLRCFLLFLLEIFACGQLEFEESILIIFLGFLDFLLLLLLFLKVGLQSLDSTLLHGDLLCD